MLKIFSKIYICRIRKQKGADSPRFAAVRSSSKFSSVSHDSALPYPLSIHTQNSHV